MNKFVKTKRFAEATQLNDEEMQAALARKNRWLKFKNFMKGLAGFGLGAAALYGGAKWYQNGGKGFVQNMMDRGADFASRVGDATVDTAKGVVNDTVNEVNRGLDQWAANRVGNQVTETPAVNQNAQANDAIAQTNQEAQDTLAKLDQQQEQQVAQANLHNQSGWNQNNQANGEVNELIQVPEEEIYGNQEVGGGNKLDPQVLNKANSIYLSVSNSNDINKLNTAISQLNALGSDPEIQNIVNNLQMKLDMITNSNSQVESQINDYNSNLAKYQGDMNDYIKLSNAGVDPGKYGLYSPQLVAPTKPTISKDASKIYYQNNKNGVKLHNLNQEQNDGVNDFINGLGNMNKYVQ